MAFIVLPTKPSADGIITQDRALGIDLYFSSDYETNAAGSLATVSGIAALNQSLYHRMITKPGSFFLRPEYGVGIQEWVKKRLTLTNLHELEQRVNDQLSFEKRITKVNNVFVDPINTTKGPGIKLGFSVQAIGMSLTFQPLTFTRDGVSLA